MSHCDKCGAHTGPGDWNVPWTDIQHVPTTKQSKVRVIVASATYQTLLDIIPGLYRMRVLGGAATDIVSYAVSTDSVQNKTPIANGTTSGSFLQGACCCWELVYFSKGDSLTIGVLGLATVNVAMQKINVPEQLVSAQ